MKKALFILFLSRSAWAACPLYTYPENPKLDQELQNVCSNIANPKQNSASANAIIMNGPFQLSALTLAQLQALSPTGLGQKYYCSTCATDAECVSTGTAKGAFSRTSARTTACQ